VTSRCVSAQGPDADRRAKLLINRLLKGAYLGAYSQVEEPSTASIAEVIREHSMITAERKLLYCCIERDIAPVFASDSNLQILFEGCQRDCA
jgi:hypothetical protein